jgi:hypothetical protein
MGGGQTAAVINITCSVAAARSGAFDKLLSKNGIATTPALDNYSQQSLARYQNFRTESGSLSQGGVQTPLGGTASLGSTGRQQQAVQQVSPEANQARREVAQNSALRNAQQAGNSQPAATFAQPDGSGTMGNNFSGTLSGSNAYGPASSGAGALNGSTQSAMADNTANGYNTPQQAGGANQFNYYGQGPAKSANTLNLGGIQGSAATTITYEVEASPAQLAALIEQVGQNREDFSAPNVPPALRRELQSASRRSFGGRGGGGIKVQPKDQAANSSGQVQSESAKGGQSQNARGKEGPADADGQWGYKLREQNLKSPAGAATDGPAQSQAAPMLAAQQAAAEGKTHVVFVLNVVERVASPPVAAPVPAPVTAPAAAAPAPAKGK